jgi:hypothetical protein
MRKQCGTNTKQRRNTYGKHTENIQNTYGTNTERTTCHTYLLFVAFRKPMFPYVSYSLTIYVRSAVEGLQVAILTILYYNILYYTILLVKWCKISCINRSMFNNCWEHPEDMRPPPLNGLFESTLTTCDPHLFNVIFECTLRTCDPHRF